MLALGYDIAITGQLRRGDVHMGKVKQLFQIISYLQYPLLLVAVGYMVYPYFVGFDSFWPSANNALIFAGLGVGFSTLQDTTKTQNEFSKKIWQDPRKGMITLVAISATTLVFLLLGMYGLYVAKPGILKEVSFGMLTLGLGYVGLLKAAIEMHEHHRIAPAIPD